MKCVIIIIIIIIIIVMGEGSPPSQVMRERERQRERESLVVPKVICCHSAIQCYLAPRHFGVGRPPGLMVIPAFIFS